MNDRPGSPISDRSPGCKPEEPKYAHAAKMARPAPNCGRITGAQRSRSVRYKHDPPRTTTMACDPGRPRVSPGACAAFLPNRGNGSGPGFLRCASYGETCCRLSWSPFPLSQRCSIRPNRPNSRRRGLRPRIKQSGQREPVRRRQDTRSSGIQRFGFRADCVSSWLSLAPAPARIARRTAPGIGR